MTTMHNKQNQFEGTWKQVRGRVREQWGELTEDDLDIIAGKRDQLVGKLQETYGIAREEAETQVRNFIADLDLDEFEVEHDFRSHRDDEVTETSQGWLLVAAAALAVFVFAIYSKLQSH